MADVFISYKKEDVAWARRIDEAMRAEGFSVFWDDQLTPDKAWDARLEEELRSARAVIVLWSPRSVVSEWVRTEAHYGQDHGKLAPVLIENCEPPLAFRLTQTIDLSDWTGDSKDRRWRKLAMWVGDLAVGSVQGDSPAAAASAAAQRRAVYGTLSTGEPVWDGATISVATPVGSVFRDGAELPVMRILPAGDFVMGSPPGETGRRESEGPQKRVRIARPFAISIHPLIWAEARMLLNDRLGARPTEAKKGAFLGLFGKRSENTASVVPPQEAKDLPATGLTLEMAQQAARRLSEITGETYRLPSEAEWEYACRSGSRQRYCWGETLTPERAAYLFNDAEPVGPKPCGSYPPNAFGLFDMHGNVREWTLDLWHDDLTDTPVDGSPALGGHSAMNVVRGGSYMDGPDSLRCAARGRATGSLGNPATGVRLVREIRQ